MAGVSAWVVPLQMANPLKHANILMNIEQYFRNRMQFPFIILTLLMLTKFFQLFLQLFQSFLLLFNPKLRLRWTNQRFQRQTTQSIVESFNNSKKLLSLNMFNFTAIFTIMNQCFWFLIFMICRGLDLRFMAGYVAVNALVFLMGVFGFVCLEVGFTCALFQHFLMINLNCLIINYNLVLICLI